MKNRINEILLWGLAALTGVVFAACNPDAGKKEFSVTFKEAGPGYITMMATVPQTTTVHYYLSKVQADGLNADMLVKNGEAEVFYRDGEQQLLGYEIAENTKYWLYLVASLANNQRSEMYTFEFSTGEFNFDQLATIVGVLPDGYKVHLKMPDSVKGSVDGAPNSTAIRYSHANVMMYNYRAESSDDYEHLLHNGGNHVRKDSTLTFSDATNWGQVGYDANGDGVTDENDKGVLWDYIAPGEPIVFIAGEFGWMQEPEGMDPDINYVVNGFFYPASWPAGYYLPKVDSAKYWSVYASEKAVAKGAGIIHDFDMSSPIDKAWTGAFQKKVFRTRQPDVIDAKIDVKVEDLRSVDATITIIPDSRLYRYVFAILDDASYRMLLEDYLNGREEYLQWAVSSYFAMMNFGASAVEAGANETSARACEIQLSDYFYDVPADTKYHVLVTGMAGEEISAPQCFTHHTFATPAKTKTKGPTIEVTALEDKATPFEAVYNVKCTSVGDNAAVRCYYGANYYKDWVLSVNSGSSYETLGQSVEFSADDVAEINSDRGLTVRIPSIDGETTRLVVVAFNDENISNGIDKVQKENVINHPAVADCVTPYYTLDDETYLQASDLLDNPVLDGDWTLTAKVQTASGVQVQKSKVSLKRKLVGGDGADYPLALPDSVFNIYKDVTKWEDDEIRGHFTKFLNLAETFNEKRLRGQNKILLAGWLDNDSKGRLAHMSPWDMFISRTINTVDVESMFSEFGPKLFLEVFKDKSGRDSLALTSDRYFASPASNWSVPFYLAARADKESNNTVFHYTNDDGAAIPLEFPVVMSENRDTITIKAIKYVLDETTGAHENYYPNLIGIDERSLSGSYILENPIVSDVVLTRGWDGGQNVGQEQEVAPTAKSGVRRGARGVSPINELPRIVLKHRTYFSKPEPVVKIKGDVLTPEKMRENLDRFKQNLFNGNK